MRKTITFRLTQGLLALAAFGLASYAFGAGPEKKEMGGTLEGTVGGAKVAFPSLKVDVDAAVRGDLATVTVTQTFVNPYDQAMHATYLFPLHQDAAVFEMVMEVGDERVRADIKKREEAVQTFEAAKQEGKAASLLVEHRPNMFTQDIANLMPGKPIKVTLRYVHAVHREDGEYQLVVPLVVGPRYQPAHAGKPPREGAGSDGEGGWKLDALPRYPPVSGLDIPDVIAKERVSLRVTLDGGLPVASVLSRTHAVDVKKLSDRKREVTLAGGGRTIDNRDFVLRYKLAGDRTSAGMLAHRDARGGFFSLLVEPPAAPAAADITAREMVFILDCSGSMAGQPIEASKAFMRQALRGLRPGDAFRIIRFSDAATEFSAEPLVATPENVRRGIAYVDQLEGEGGTEMTAGIAQALDVPVPPGSIRLVTFLTDGYIGNEQEVLGLIKRKIGDARLFAFGVGTAVNRYLMDEMGAMGRGFTRYMDPTEDNETVAKELAERLDAPVLTDVTIDWGGLAPTGVVPERVPDLFAGKPLRIQGRYKKAGTYTIRITGKVAGRDATLPLTVRLPEASDKADAAGGEALPLTWARAQVGALMADLSTPATDREPRRSDEEITAAVTELGLAYRLVTRWTAFVAVSEKVHNTEPDKAVKRDVPLHQVAAVAPSAYPQAAFGGSSAPEPGTLGGILVTALAAAAAARRRRKEQLNDKEVGHA